MLQMLQCIYATAVPNPECTHTADKVDFGSRVEVVHLHVDGLDTDAARTENCTEKTERD